MHIHDSQDSRGRGEAIYLTLLYHFHLLHRHLDISREITAESSPLHIASSRTRTGNFWFPSASAQVCCIDQTNLVDLLGHFVGLALKVLTPFVLMLSYNSYSPVFSNIARDLFRTRLGSKCSSGCCRILDNMQINGNFGTKLI